MKIYTDIKGERLIERKSGRLSIYQQKIGSTRTWGPKFQGGN